MVEFAKSHWLHVPYISEKFASYVDGIRKYPEFPVIFAFGTPPAILTASAEWGGRHLGSETMFDTRTSISDARHFLLAVGAGLLFALACLTAAIGPVNANCSCAAPGTSLDRPTLQ